MRTPLARRALSHDGLTRAERLRETRARRRRVRKTFGSALLSVVMSIPLMLAVSGGATADAAPVSVFSEGSAPNTVSSDVNAVELGMRFRSSIDGTVTAISYFKATGAPAATKSGHLWSSTGQLLASVRSPTRQRRVGSRQPCRRPWPIAAATTYVVSYFAPKGGYTSTHNYFTTAVVNGPLTAPSSGNGVFCYADIRMFPEPDLPVVELLRRSRSSYRLRIRSVVDDDGPDHRSVGDRPTTTATTTTTFGTTTTTGATDDDDGADTRLWPDDDDNCTGSAGAVARTLNCAPSPSLCGFPDETNTGSRRGCHVDEGAVAGDVWSWLVVFGGELFDGGVRSPRTWVRRSTGLELADGITARGAVDLERGHDHEPEDRRGARQLLRRGHARCGVTQRCDHRCEVQGAPQ